MVHFGSIVPVLALLAIVGAAGCVQRQAAETFHVDLAASHEAPPTDSTGRGTAELTLDPASKQLSWKISYAGLTSDATAALIHGPARPGYGADALVDLAPNGVKNPITGSTTLSDATIDYLTLRRCYINVHTTRYPAGEIRGQIVP
jgi:hypothetical protein